MSGGERHLTGGQGEQPSSEFTAALAAIQETGVMSQSRETPHHVGGNVRGGGVEGGEDQASVSPEKVESRRGGRMSATDFQTAMSAWRRKEKEPGRPLFRR